MTDFESLKNLLYAESWPEAVDPTQICGSENDKLIRADWILDVLIDENLKNKTFLDFGTGEGHVAIQASKRTLTSFAYDTTDNITLSTPKPDNFRFFNNFSDLDNCSPFDVILLHDVLDHTPNPIEILGQVKSILNSEGVVYVRTHPFCSRHGQHLYKQLNKAFVHLVFDKNELEKLNLTPEQTIKIIHPLATYGPWFQQAGFKVVSEFVVKDPPVESFFTTNKLVKERILRNWKTSNDKDLSSGKSFPKFQMQQGFINYKLKK